MEVETKKSHVLYSTNIRGGRFIFSHIFIITFSLIMMKAIYDTIPYLVNYYMKMIYLGSVIFLLCFVMFESYSLLIHLFYQKPVDIIYTDGLYLIDSPHNKYIPFKDIEKISFIKSTGHYEIYYWKRGKKKKLKRYLFYQPDRKFLRTLKGIKDIKLEIRSSWED